MVTLKTQSRFFDKQEKITRELGSVFQANEERAKFLIGLGFVVKEDPLPDEAKESEEKPEQMEELKQPKAAVKAVKKETRKPQKQTPEN